MSVSHKTRVIVQFLLPLALSYAALVSYFFVALPWNLSTLAKSLAGAGATALALALVQDLIPKSLKEALVFLRVNDRLPGHRCFDLANDNPSRFDRKKIKNISMLSKASAPDQQRAFFSLYTKVSKKPSVEHYSVRYLAWRDMAAVSLVLALATIPVFGFTNAGILPAAKLAGVMFIICAASIVAARHAAHELIMQVLSLSIAG